MASAGRASASREVAQPGEHVQFLGQVRHQAGRRGHVLVDVPEGDLGGHLAGERLPAGEHLEEHDARGVDVGAGVGDAPGDQFRRQVGDGAEQDAGAGGRGGGGAGQAEVGDLDPAVVGEDDVLGLDVAVHDAGAVRGAERVEHRFEHGQRLPRARARRARSARRAGCGPATYSMAR